VNLRLLLSVTFLLLPAATLRLGAADVLEIPYTVDPNFLKLPLDLLFGETSGVAVNSQKNIVLNRDNFTLTKGRNGFEKSYTAR